MNKKSTVLKNRDYSWDGVEKKEYKTNTSDFKDIHRYTLLGDEYSELNFQTRYFEIQPGGYSSLEYHRHPHSVIIIKGKGSVILDNDLIEVNQFDVVYISPKSLHQFHADKGEPLGFICTVDRYRDRPVVPDDEKIAEVIYSEIILKKIRK